MILLVSGDAGDGLVMDAVGSGDLPITVAVTNALADGCRLLGGELGLAAKPLVAAPCFRNALEGRFRMRTRSSSNTAESRPRRPRPMGVVRSSALRSRTRMVAPAAWMRAMRAMLSIIERVARSHSATTNT
jgi:hypothetical protein